MKLNLIQEFRLAGINNSLYIQFMADVDSVIRQITPEKLNAVKCYEAFSEGRRQVQAAFGVQQKNNLTAVLDKQHQIRLDRFRCLKKHVEADAYNEEKAIRESARIVMNWVELFASVPRSGRRAISASIRKLCKGLEEERLISHVEFLGQSANLAALKAANEKYVNLSHERVESKKDIVVNAMKDARALLDSAYRDLVMVINSQITLRMLVDSGTTSQTDDNLPEVQEIDAESDPLGAFVQHINVIIWEYRTTIAQSGSNKGEKADSAAKNQPSSTK